MVKSAAVSHILKFNRLRKKTFMFNYEGENNSSVDNETIFPFSFFIIIICKALSSLNLCFNQFKTYNDKFGCPISHWKA